MNPRTAVAYESVKGRLPWLDRTAAATARLFHDLRMRPRWSGAIEGLEFTPLATAPKDPVFRLLLDTVHGTATAFFCAPSYPSLSVAASHSTDMPAGLQALASEAALQPLLDVLGALGLAHTRVEGLTAMQHRDSEVPFEGWVQMSLHAEPIASFRCTDLPDALLRRLYDRLAPPRFVLDIARSLEMPGSVLLSARTVRRAVLESLQCGDVLLFLSDGQRTHAACNVSFGARGGRRWCADAVVEDTFITIQGAGRMIEDDTQVPDVLDEGAAVSLQELEIPVRFEVDTVALPLSRIEGMAPGYVIELAAPLEGAPLRLVACGRVIGMAELVAVGDRLGARITHTAYRDATRTGH